MKSNDKRIVELTPDEVKNIRLCIKYMSKGFEKKWLVDENDYDALNGMYLCDELAKKFE